jgi:dienelactone hydrolase
VLKQKGTGIPSLYWKLFQPINNYLKSEIMKKMLVLVLLLFLNFTSSFGQAATEQSGFNDLVLDFFQYDRQENLNVREKLMEETDLYKRQKIVFDGFRKNRVPGYIATPKQVGGPYPCILLFHSGIGSKDVWWEEDSFEFGKLLVDQLLTAGYAVLMLDAQYHGERTAGNDYGISPNFMGANDYREQMLETTIDYRIALDYLSTRGDIDMDRIGAFGTSIGANMILVLSTVDPRLKTMVLCSTIMQHPYFSGSLSVSDPINATPTHPEAQVLVQVGKTDDFSPREKVDRVFEQLHPAQKELRFYEFGHRPKPVYISDALDWFKKYL